MIDWDVVHAVFQFPTAIVEIMVAIMMLMRWEWAGRSQTGTVLIARPITLLVGLFLLVIGVKQGYWMLQGALEASDLHLASEVMRTSKLFAIVCNGLITLIGGALLAVVGAPMLGRTSYVVASMSCVGLFGIGILLSTWG